jgi:histone acetyltransferase (RNA polymerase elongator complex component)
MNCRPLIVPVFIPHAGCPHRCVFCNQEVVTSQPEMHPGPEGGFATADEFLRFRGRRQGPAQIAFYGGNFLGLPTERIRCLLTTATAWINERKLDGIRFSTRPDTIDSHSLDLINSFPIKCVELGVQSMDDDVLQQSRRGHTATDTVVAVRRLQARGYDVGLQLMVGLPGDDEARMMETGRRIASLNPAFVRIYPTLVLEGSLLATWFREDRYRPLSLNEAVDLSMKLYRFFRQRGIPVIRTGLQPSEGLNLDSGMVAGPFHPAFGQLVQSACYLEAVRGALGRGDRLPDTIELRVHPSSSSHLRGQGNANLAALRREFGFLNVRVMPDSTLIDEVIALPEGKMIRVYEPIDADFIDLF